MSCTLSLACRLRHCCLLDRVCCTLSGACFPVARPSAPSRVVCVVCRLAHVASRHVACFCVARRRLHVACRMFPVASCLLSVACPIMHAVRCMLQNARSLLLLVSCPCRSHSGTSSVACRRLHVVGCNVAERHSAVAHAAHRGGASPLSASVAGKTRYRPRCACVRACVRACVWVASVTLSLWVAVRA